MKPAKYPHVKICCISSTREADLAVKYGASAIGLVGKMPSGPGVISDELIAEIAAGVPGYIYTFLLTSETTAEEIISHHRKVNTSTIQIVDRIETVVYTTLRNELPAIKLVQVIHVLDENSVTEAAMYAEYADALLLDSGNPALAVKQLGGTGRTHNWELSLKIRELVDIPIYLAGGINPANVKDAFNFVKPYGIDLCSGVRTAGRLDEIKLKEFFEEVKKVKST
ncbi:MAG: phosphoribosylanthranilate isomerase [Ignavibacteria bacterium]|nr:phosphoribosylanthranilate isomerase [Ignavibacteria bacterium]